MFSSESGSGFQCYDYLTTSWNGLRAYWTLHCNMELVFTKEGIFNFWALEVTDLIENFFSALFQEDYVFGE